MSTQKSAEVTQEARDANRDPITGEAGAHPAGVGAGAATGGLAGGAIGAVAGPVGAVIGVVAGSIAGGLAGKGVAESIDPTVEDTYWRGTYHTRPYVNKGETYEVYQPAYRYGWEARRKHQGKTFAQIESDLKSGWGTSRLHSTHDWDKARPAVQDAWTRFDNR